MRIDELKRGVWGYRRDSVYHYIVSVEEKASARMAEKDARLEEAEAEAQRRISELEETVKALREENTALRENQEMVFSTMLEAQKYAEQTKADTERQKRQAQKELSAAVQQKNRQLDGYQEQIRQLRGMIQKMLEDVGSRLEDTEHTLICLKSQVPTAELGSAPAEADNGESEARRAFS